MIIIHSDYSDVYNELDRLESMPTPKMVANLETVLEFGFDSVHAGVHVDTGRLKASGKKTSKVNKNDWNGSFSFGEPAAGVDYAIYEKARGGDHNFLSPTFILKHMFKEAIKRGLRRK